MTTGEGTCLSPRIRICCWRPARPAVPEQAGMRVDEVLSVKQVDIRHGHVEFEGLPAGHRGRHARHARQDQRGRGDRRRRRGLYRVRRHHHGANGIIGRKRGRTVPLPPQRRGRDPRRLCPVRQAGGRRRHPDPEPAQPLLLPQRPGSEGGDSACARVTSSAASTSPTGSSWPRARGLGGEPDQAGSSAATSARRSRSWPAPAQAEPAGADRQAAGPHPAAAATARRQAQSRDPAEDQGVAHPPARREQILDEQLVEAQQALQALMANMDIIATPSASSPASRWRWPITTTGSTSSTAPSTSPSGRISCN